MRGRLPCKPIDRDELTNILREHRLWIHTRGEQGERADLAFADLSGVDLSGVELDEAVLTGADLTGADLSGAELNSAYCFRADFTGANLHGADLEGIVMNNAEGIIQIGPVGSEGRMCYAVRHEACVMVQAGCWWGTTDELRGRVAGVPEEWSMHYPTQEIEAERAVWRRQYQALCNFAEAYFQIGVVA